MLTLLRLTTVHPVLVHFTIGALPIIFVAYLVGASRHDPRWTFVGDAATVVTALLSLGTVAFGLVSNWTLEWPGSLETFRWLHVGVGAASAALLCGFAVYRVVRRRREDVVNGAGTVVAVAVIGACLLVTGWVGGEVLVYRSGMAVVAAGDGALAQPTSKKPAEPRDIPEAMAAVQAAWGSANATIAGMIVRQPSGRAFESVERDAAQLGRVAAWMGTEGAKQVRQNRDAFSDVSRRLEMQAADLEHAARAQDVRDSAGALGAIETTCAECHVASRWTREATAAP
jgi:uncharacterized membrane protein